MTYICFGTGVLGAFLVIKKALSVFPERAFWLASCSGIDPQRKGDLCTNFVFLVFIEFFDRRKFNARKNTRHANAYRVVLNVHCCDL